MWTVGDACWFKMASIASAECENAHTALAETKAERGRCISSLSLSIYTRILSHPIPFILVCSQALMDAYLHTSPSSPFQGYSPGREDEEEPRRGSGGERGCAHLCAFQQSLSAFDLKKKMWHQRSFLCRGAPLAGHCGGRVTQQLWAGPGLARELQSWKSGQRLAQECPFGWILLVVAVRNRMRFIIAVLIVMISLACLQARLRMAAGLGDGWVVGMDSIEPDWIGLGWAGLDQT